MLRITNERVLKTLDAIVSPTYDVSAISQFGPLLLPNLDRRSVFLKIPFLRARNAGGSGIYITPTGPIWHTVLDDLCIEAARQMSRDGFNPCAVIETSPNNFQVWLKHGAEMTKELASLASKTLSQRYGADLSATGWRRLGRLPGFTNRKSKHQLADGRYPFVLLHHGEDRVYRCAGVFRAEMEQLLSSETARRDVISQAQRRTLSPQRGRRYSHLSVIRFRNLPKFRDNPTGEDMAYCIAAAGLCMPESSIREALRKDYVSRDPSTSRREAYIDRTIKKALRTQV